MGIPSIARDLFKEVEGHNMRCDGVNFRVAYGCGFPEVIHIVNDLLVY
jgi:hypothetical protein